MKETIGAAQKTEGAGKIETIDMKEMIETIDMREMIETKEAEVMKGETIQGVTEKITNLLEIVMEIETDKIQVTFLS